MIRGRDINTVLNQCERALDLQIFNISRQKDV